ncbi:MAG: metal ABC transporter ATP-binding protein [Planctomycetota bacterium]
MPPKIPAVEVKQLTVAYDANPVLWDLNLTIDQQVVMGLVGPNGAGKSTLLKSILGLTPKLYGEVSILGKPFESDRKQISYVPQRSAIDWDFPTTVLDLVMMGTYGRLGWFRRPGKREKNDSIAALERLSMAEFSDRQISELSGGQQQRVFLARAFVQNAPIYFLDEPFAGVDVVTERAIVDFLHELRNSGKTIVVVQHDLGTVGTYLDQVTLINKSIIASGDVSDVFNDAAIEETYCARRQFNACSVERKESGGVLLTDGTSE